LSIGQEFNCLGTNEFCFDNNYPNPFIPSTQIAFSVPKSGYISLKVYNLLGKGVAKLFEGVRDAGNHIINFDATNLPGVVYLFRLKTKEFTETKKLILLK